jgi:hypothetical protein
MSNSKNDNAWNDLFEKYKISEEVNAKGFYKIKALEINEFREARLMTKFDFKSQLPKIFTENNLSILPISRGGYIISDFNIFQDFESNENEITRINFPSYIESIDFNSITSEAIALNCAYISGIIEDFVQDEELKPTVSGRMSSSIFDFNINSKKELLNINVNNSQIEIDGGYEGIESLNLIEAKNSISKDFLIRQVFYPFKLWENKITKKVRNLFLTYSNGIFHFREYIFEDPTHYNSLKLTREKKYVIRDGIINLELIQKWLSQVKIVKEATIPFPQADSFERVINLCELLNENKELSQEYITNNYDFNVRQTNYYTNAGKYLSLIDSKRKKGKIIYFLTDNGQKLFNLPIIDRQQNFIELILSHLAFNETLKYYFKKGELPNIEEIVKIMKVSHLYNVKEKSTYERRASTISSWVNWILDQIEE